MKKKKIDLFDYHDYRSYLKDWFEHARENQSLSLRDIAEKCDLSTGYLPMILSEQRNLSEKSFLKLQEILKLNQEESNYFKYLLVLSDGAISKERLSAFEEIKKVKSFQKKSLKEIEVHKYLSNWLHVAIREMSFRRDFENSSEWVQARLVYKVHLRDIQTALEFLIENKFITQSQSGKYMPSEKQLDCFNGVFRLSLGEFHRQMFSLASQSIDVTPRDQRNLLGHTLLIPENQIEALRNILDETLKKVEALGSDFREAGPVYHVILAGFPVIKKG